MCYRCDHFFQDRAMQRMRSRRLNPAQVLAWMLRHIGPAPTLAALLNQGAMLDSSYRPGESVQVRASGIPIHYSLS